jgi:DNA-binding response OmpR family regulator
MAVPLVLIVEDDPAIRELVGFHLVRAGMEVVSASGAAEARAACLQRCPDVVVLDLMLPDGSGWDLCREIGERSGPDQVRPGVLMLTALGAEADRVAGLELGADDYVAKPFSPRELVARVRAVLRRREPPRPRGPAPAAASTDPLRIGPLTIERRRVQASVGGRPVPLTATEFRLLCALAEAAGEVRSRDALLDVVWGPDFFGDRRTVDVHVRHIREKLEQSGAGGLLQTVRGFGYRLQAGGDEG